MESRDTSFTKPNIFIDICFKEDHPNTRTKVKGQPLQSLQTEMFFFLNSFIQRTTRNLRLNNFTVFCSFNNLD